MGIFVIPKLKSNILTGVPKNLDKIVKRSQLKYQKKGFFVIRIFVIRKLQSKILTGVPENLDKIIERSQLKYQTFWEFLLSQN